MGKLLGLKTPFSFKLTVSTWKLYLCKLETEIQLNQEKIMFGKWTSSLHKKQGGIQPISEWSMEIITGSVIWLNVISLLRKSKKT